MAFLVCVGLSVYGALQKLLYCVPAPLNAALGAVRNFLVQISNFSLTICSGFSAI